MNCFNCGASVSGEHKNCPYCGQSMQIVPDYNFLDDDNINVLIEESPVAEPEKSVEQEAAERIRKRKAKQKELEIKRKQEKRKTRLMILILIAVVAVCGIVFSAFFAINDMIQKQNASSYTYQINQAEKALEEDDFELAKTYYYNALALRPNDLDVRFTLAELYSDRGLKDDMVAMYKDIIAVDSQNYTAFKMLIAYYRSINDIDAILTLRESATADRVLTLFSEYAVDTPNIYLKGGEYETALDVMITSKLNYQIYYTIDGRDPTKYGIPYDGTIHIEKSGFTTLKAVSKNERGVYSSIVQETYNIRYKAPDDPIVKPEGIYTFDRETYLELELPSGCTAYYAWDLDELVMDIRKEDANRAVYENGILVPSGMHKLTLVIIDNTSGLSSSIYRQMYTCTKEGIPVPEQFIPVVTVPDEENPDEENPDVENP